jgi:5-methylcytosine-specific restriction enzyme A
MEGAADPRYRTTAWKRLRAKVIAERPMCEGRCGGLYEARYVDHQTEVSDDPSDWNFFNEAGLVPLCPACHALKTADERDRRLGRKSRPRYLRGCDVNGDPLDPLHPWNRE